MAERDTIPADLHEEILCLLPSNDLLNLKRVCKDWNELISSQRFIQKHLRRSTGTLIFKLGRRQIILCHDPAGNKIYRNISYPPINGIVSYPPDFPSAERRIAGSCDGLVCLVLLNSNVFAIINPSTGESDVRTVDRFYFHHRQVFWFGKHPSTGEYLMIVLTATPSGMTRVYQFSGKPGLWEYFPIPPTAANYYPPTASITMSKPILLHGALHWLVIHHDLQMVVLAYDIQKNTLLELSLSFGQPPSRVSRLGTVEGCLSAIVRNWRERKFELWVMKEYGVEESWIKYCNIEGFDEYFYMSPLVFVADGVILLNVCNELVVKYSLSDKKSTVVHRVNTEEFLEPDVAVLCGDSLMSPLRN